MNTNRKHSPVIHNGRIVCSCGDFNCASLDSLSPSEVEEILAAETPDLEDGPEIEDMESEQDEPTGWMTDADMDAEADRAADRYENQF